MFCQFYSHMRCPLKHTTFVQFDTILIKFLWRVFHCVILENMQRTEILAYCKQLTFFYRSWLHQHKKCTIELYLCYTSYFGQFNSQKCLISKLLGDVTMGNVSIIQSYIPKAYKVFAFREMTVLYTEKVIGLIYYNLICLELENLHISSTSKSLMKWGYMKILCVHIICLSYIVGLCYIQLVYY